MGSSQQVAGFKSEGGSRQNDFEIRKTLAAQNWRPEMLVTRRIPSTGKAVKEVKPYDEFSF